MQDLFTIPKKKEREITTINNTIHHDEGGRPFETMAAGGAGRRVLAAGGPAAPDGPRPQGAVLLPTPQRRGPEDDGQEAPAGAGVDHPVQAQRRHVDEAPLQGARRL